MEIGHEYTEVKVIAEKQDFLKQINSLQELLRLGKEQEAMEFLCVLKESQKMEIQAIEDGNYNYKKIVIT